MSASATPASLEALKDREVALKLLEMEGELWTQIEAFRDLLHDVDVGERIWGELWGELEPFIARLEGEFGHLLTVVVERLSPGVESAYIGEEVETDA